MKTIIFISTMLLNALLCAQTPSQNPQLNAISPSGTSKKSEGFMQNSLDTWLQNDWEPTQEKLDSEEKVLSTSIEKPLELNATQEESPFKLQTYVDKWKRYNKEREKAPKSPSHVEKINALPAIGK
jgi:hypothetical protein